MQAAGAVDRGRAALRVALSHYVANGLSVAAGLLLISGGIQFWLGTLAASAAAVGVIVTSPPDLPGPRRGKFLQMLPAPLIGLPLFFVVQMLHAAPIRLGLVLVPATFIAFVAMAWGKRGIPIAIAVMLAMVLSMATPKPSGLAEAIERTWHFGLGAALYVLYATLANLALNGRYRTLSVADVLMSLAALMRTEASQFVPQDETRDIRDTPAPMLGRLLREQAALADQLQATRDIVLESPRTPRRQRLAGMLVVVLELRDHLLASELDLDALKAHPAHTDALIEMRRVLEELADETAALADSLLLGRRPSAVATRRPRLAAIHLPDDPTVRRAGPTPALLARGLASRIGHINDEVMRLAAIARGDTAPDLAVVRTNWQLFVSPTAWSWRPFLTLWRWDAVAGTLLGCVFAVGLLSTHPTPLGLLGAMVVAQAIAHGFAVRRYLITAVAATVLGLSQAHLLHAGVAPTFALFERVADTLIGATVAWAFCYVLPSWERHQLPALVARVLTAQALHARLALGLGQLQAVDSSPELEWRLARREAFDSLSALVQATQRALSEPRAVQPPIEPLEHLQAHSYQLLAQLSAVKSMLVLRRDRLTPAEVSGPLARTAARIEVAIGGSAPTAGPALPAQAPSGTPAGPIPLLDPFENDISPWLLRRLDLATTLATQVRDDAARILQSLDTPPDSSSPLSTTSLERTS
ncbi:MAG: FUSC family protein [Variovorax sp.]|nr:MAG: FUSC family protein [Variovorax sp.]